MKVEHLTLGGNSLVRDTADILKTTRDALKILSFDYRSQTVVIPNLPFRVKITATDEGAMFDIMSNVQIAITNVCCFDVAHSKMLLDLIDDMADKMFKFGHFTEVVIPSEKKWLYSIIVNPLALPAWAIPIAGEVELYIYNELYNAKNKNHG